MYFDVPPNIPDFLNEYFVNIAYRTRGPDVDIEGDIDYDIHDREFPGFDLNPVMPETVLAHLDDIDVNMSSCIDGINMKMCKILVKHFPEIWAKLLPNSMFCGIFPREWVLGSFYSLKQGTC